VTDFRPDVTLFDRTGKETPCHVQTDNCLLWPGTWLCVCTHTLLMFLRGHRCTSVSEVMGLGASRLLTHNPKLWHMTETGKTQQAFYTDCFPFYAPCSFIWVTRSLPFPGGDKHLPVGRIGYPNIRFHCHSESTMDGHDVEIPPSLSLALSLSCSTLLTVVLDVFSIYFGSLAMGLNRDEGGACSAIGRPRSDPPLLTFELSHLSVQRALWQLRLLHL